MIRDSFSPFKIQMLVMMMGCVIYTPTGLTAGTSATGVIQLGVEQQNVIESIAPINFGTLTSAALASAAQTGTTALRIYTTAPSTPSGGLSVSIQFDNFDKTASKPYLWISSSGTPLSPLYYDASIYNCNGGSKISLTQGGSQNATITLKDNILSSQCVAPTGSAGKLEVTVNQYDTSTKPPIVGGTYIGTITMTVGSAGG